jgi:succinate dehydrogenase / fumarate reductase, cytochrome b subunit
MGWFIQFIDSSIGKKLIMALTGLFLYIYLIIHLAANLLLLQRGGYYFGIYVDVMTSGVNIPIRIIEVLLFLLFIYHIINGVRLAKINSSARGKNYKVNSPSENSSFYSRFMVQSGIVILIFLVLHLIDFFIPYKFSSPEITMYEMAVAKFQETWRSVVYIIAMVLLAFHLIHAFQSGFQTLGLNHNKYTPAIKSVGFVLSIIISLGFAVIPLYFLLGGGR